MEPSFKSASENSALGPICDKALERGDGTSPHHPLRTHQFTVDACGGDAELICVLQKVMESFMAGGEPLGHWPKGMVNQSAVAEWFYAKYRAKP